MHIIENMNFENGTKIGIFKLIFHAHLKLMHIVHAGRHTQKKDFIMLRDENNMISAGDS